MNLLITGIAGFVGRHLAERAIVDGHAVFGFSIEEDAPHLVPDARVTVGDVTDRAAVSEVFAADVPDVIVHLAGSSSVGRSFAAPLETWRTNVDGTLTVLEAAREAVPDARCLVVTSAEIYGTVPLEDLPVTPETPLRPVSPYGASKAAADLAAYQYRMAYGQDVVRVRPFNHIGPGQDPRFVVPSVARQVAQAEHEGREQLTLNVGNVETRRDFTDVRDIVEAYMLIAERGDPETAYQPCTGRSVSIRELIEGIAELSHLDTEVVSDPDLRREGEQPDLYGSPGSLRDELGWSPQIELEQTLADTLEWWRSELQKES